MKTTLLSLLCLGILFINSILFAQGASFKVIVNSSNPVSSMSKEDIAKMFLKKVIAWENGIKVVPVDKEEKSPERISFSKDIINKPVNAVKAYWYQKLFSGRDVPPRTEQFDEAILKFVHANTGAIGYVSKGASFNNYNIKVLTVTN